MERIKGFVDRLPSGAVVEFPNRPDDGQHVVIRDLGAAWSLANFIHEARTALPGRVRVGIFDAIGPNELFLDPISQKTDGDAHAYAERMLPFSKEADGGVIIM